MAERPARRGTARRMGPVTLPPRNEIVMWSIDRRPETIQHGFEVDRCVGAEMRFGIQLPSQQSTRSGQKSYAFEDCSSEEAHVLQSVALILQTRPGYRPLEPDFGCRIHELMFRPITPALRAQAEFFIIQALKTWEPRIEIVSVSVSEEAPSELRARIMFVTGQRAVSIEAILLVSDGRMLLGEVPDGRVSKRTVSNEIWANS